jgi:hypothetical protein
VSSLAVSGLQDGLTLYMWAVASFETSGIFHRPTCHYMVLGVILYEYRCENLFIYSTSLNISLKGTLLAVSLVMLNNTFPTAIEKALSIWL